ncbi:MAG: hypothetical protein JST28_00350 [Acidobacteria bacterium]|nr:hypothetical protein [Acidobacteriota bacterium]
MDIPQPKAKTRAIHWTSAAIFFGLLLIGKLVDDFLLDLLPRALHIASEIVGAIILTLWLGMQGYERFLKPGRDEVDIIRIGISDGDLHT